MHSKRAISKFHGEKQFIAKLCVQMQRQGEMWRRVQVWQQGEMRRQSVAPCRHRVSQTFVREMGRQKRYSVACLMDKASI